MISNLKREFSFFVMIVFFYSCVSFARQEMITGREMGTGRTSTSTHVPALVTVIAKTEGPILELGAGDFSTPLLHAICSGTQRTLVTAEMDKNWLQLFLDLERDWHNFVHVAGPSAWDLVGQNTHWSVVFVDHHPGWRRAVDIKRLRSHTDIFVAHDTDIPQDYGYNSIIPSFKYKYVYRRYKRTTTVFSDTIDVAKLFED